ncbi:MAG TPA: Gfo/Idh/MocA family oxidoreductase [Acidimicrobiales bacterium]|nr:Gfo/Idh/MocA family oxidoreductase [Acidimicrobiales bacterium]
MASEPFRLGLVGAGRMGATHLRALERSSEVRVVAVAEPVDALRDAAASAHGLAAFASVDDLLDAGGVEGVLVVTPSPTHVAVIERVAGAGLPILCEKPCGVAPADTRRAAEVVARAGVALQVAYWRRFVPELVGLRERIGGGELGELLHLTCLQWDGSPPAARFRVSSGGIFVDMGVHEFDQSRWLTGGDLVDVAAIRAGVVTDEDAGGDPDAAQATARSTSGATVAVSLGRYYPGGDVASVEAFGTAGHEYSLFLDPASGEAAQLAALARQAAAFARYARGGPCEGATVDDAVAALEAATAATGASG